MKRWVYFFICLLASAALFIAGWLVPAHLRAVNATVLQAAGQNTPGLVERGLALVEAKYVGAAELLLQAAQNINLPDQERLDAEISRVSQSPGIPAKAQPFTSWVIQTENREQILKSLGGSSSPLAHQLMRTRILTNTVLFPPSHSSSGQAFDAAVATCGLLLENHHLTPSLSENISATSAAALRGESSQPFEQILLDLTSLGQRLNWIQLAAFCRNIEDAETLRLLANLARGDESHLPELFSAVELSGEPAAVAHYLMNFSQSGMNDLAASLRFGAGGVKELLQRNQRLHGAVSQGKLNGVSAAFVHLSWKTPRLALALKWILFLLGGFLLAMALHLAKPPPPVLERPLQVRGVHFAREILFGLGFLLVVLLLSEPFLAQESQRVDFPLRLRLPMVGGAAPAGILGNQTTFMNPEVLITMSIFFVLQALLYIMCLVKLAEIRRQQVAPRIKLRLLENEDHLFDAGLYLGFLGTIVSLILVSLGVFKQPSLMAAYSATSFGILFVVLFKVVHLRPARRKLLLEAEKTAEPATPERPFAAPL